MTVIRDPRLRRLLRWLLPLAVIPTVALVGNRLLPDKQHLLLSLAVAILSLLLFTAGFEEKQTGARRMVLAAILTALSVVGRLIPLLKPVTAMTILAALWLGRESGFLVGALTALLSNFAFGQGPWTPFQMLAWGGIGYLAGLLATPLRRHRWLLLLYGALSGVVYSLVMDIWTVLWYHDAFDLALYARAILAALPHALLYALSNLLFLALLAKPFGAKLERMTVKYGL